jgi:hypothetical protein
LILVSSTLASGGGRGLRISHSPSLDPLNFLTKINKVGHIHKIFKSENETEVLDCLGKLRLSNTIAIVAGSAGFTP